MRPSGVRSSLFAALLLGSGALACESPLETPICAAPVIIGSIVSANQSNSLSAVVTMVLHEADSVAVKVFETHTSDGDRTPATPARDDVVVLPVLGLRSQTDYTLQPVAFNECGSTAGPVLPFTTSVLPSDLPSYTAAGSDPSEGYVVFAAGNYGVVIDNTGRVVWYHRFPNGPGLNFQAQPNGRYTARPNPLANGSPVSWVEVDPLGNVTRTIGCAGGLQPRLHDLLAQRDGSYWILCDEVRTMDLSAAGGSRSSMVQGTVVQHVSADGTALFHWSPFDHLEIDLDFLDPSDRSGTLINWTHGNAIDVDSIGNVLVSFRNLSEITKIDSRTGAVVWRMGGRRNQFTFQNTTAPAFARQHGVRRVSEGNVLLLDNLGDPVRSRAERYEFDEKTRVVRLRRSYASSTGAVAQTGGTTQNLSGGRTLVSFGSGGSVEEYDAEGNVVWRIEGNPGYVFRAQRIRSLYAPGVGDSR